MKKITLSPTTLLMVLSIHVLLATQAFAWTENDFMNSMSNLDVQTAKLSTQSSRTCEKENAKYFQHDTVRISMFHGYGNFEKITVDKLYAHTMGLTLKQECLPNLEACGFKTIEKSANLERLQKTVHGKKVIISLYSVSLTEDNLQNSDPHGLYWKQEELSRRTKALFYKDLVQSDVVIYSGHARVGGGLGFDVSTPALIGFNYLFKADLKPIVKALEQRPSRLKLFAVLACDSEKYYRHSMVNANPDLSLLLTKKEFTVDENEQVAVGIINSVLMKKCDREFRQALSPEIEKGDNITYIRR